MTEPSVLEYSRYFGLTQDHYEVDLWQYLGDDHSRKSRSQFFELDQDDQRIHQTLLSAANKCVFDDNNETERTIEAAEYLREIIIVKESSIDIICRDLLPNPRVEEEYKIELPLLLAGGDVKKDARRVRRGINLEQALEDVLEDYEGIPLPSEPREQLSYSNSCDRVLDIIRDQLNRAAQPEPLKLSRAVVDYVCEALSSNSNAESRFALIDKSFPELSRTSSTPPRTLEFTDFDADSEHEEDRQEVRDPTGTSLSNAMCGIPTPSASNDDSVLSDRELLSYLDVEFVEDIVLSGQCSNPPPLTDMQNASTGDMLERSQNSSMPVPRTLGSPSRKRRKLTHISASVDVYIETSADHSPISSGVFAVAVPQLDPYAASLPTIDVNALAQTTFQPSPAKSHPVEAHISTTDLPFRIPSLQDIFRPELPLDNLIMEKFIGKPKKILRSEQILWKEPGIRLLDLPEEGMEDLEESDFLSSDDEPEIVKPSQPQFVEGHKSKVVSLQRPICVNQRPASNNQACSTNSPRIFELDPEFQKFQPQRPISKHSQNSSKPLSAKIKPIVSLLSTLPLKQNVQGAALNGRLSDNDRNLESESLFSFMKLRGKQFKPLPQVLSPTKSSVHRMEVDSDPIQCSQMAKSGKSKEQELAENSHEVCAIQQSLPDLLPCDEIKIIVMNDLLLNQKPLLVQFLESQICEPSSLIFRDLGCDANKGPDIILNPTTCLFIISLQLLSQRPLPGQRSRTGLSSVHDQICAAVESHDQVIVLVHFVISDDKLANQKTHNAQSEFVSFCHELSARDEETSILPIWLPCTSAPEISEAVNRWIWRIIRQHAFSPHMNQTPEHTQGALIDDVTLWELLLMKTGLNPMAAQVVISMLRDPAPFDAMQLGGDTTWGLRRLMAMSKPERHKLFDQAIGRRAVERLSIAVSR